MKEQRSCGTEVHLSALTGLYAGSQWNQESMTAEKNV